MLREHPQGAGPQWALRCVIFSAPSRLAGRLALPLQPCNWPIVIDGSAGTPTRQQHQHRVVGMNRFLIRASVRCHNLAARALGMARLHRDQPEGRAQCKAAPSLHPGLEHRRCAAGSVGRAQCAAPVVRAQDDFRATSDIPSTRKRTYSWIQGLRECIQVPRQLPDTRLVCVMDREADFFELFDEQRNNAHTCCGRVDLLVRAKHDRVTSGPSNLFDSLSGSPVRDRMLIDVPRQSARPKKSGQKPKAGHPQRTTQVALRYREIELQPPPQHHAKQPKSCGRCTFSKPAGHAQPSPSSGSC